MRIVGTWPCIEKRKVWQPGRSGLRKVKVCPVLRGWLISVCVCGGGELSIPKSHASVGPTRSAHGLRQTMLVRPMRVTLFFTAQRRRSLVRHRALYV